MAIPRLDEDNLDISFDSDNWWKEVVPREIEGRSRSLNHLEHKTVYCSVRGGMIFFLYF